MLTKNQQEILEVYNQGITRIYFSGAKNTSKNFLADYMVMECLENDPLANAVGFRDSKVNAVQALTNSFIKHVNLRMVHGYEPGEPWEKKGGNIFRKKFKGAKQNHKNQGLFLYSMENNNAVSNVSFTNKGYAAFAFMDEVCSADEVHKSPEKIRERWETSTGIIEDAIKRSVKVCEQQNPELAGKIPPTKWMYLFNLWVPEHPVSVMMEKYNPERNWSNFIFPDWFRFYEVYELEKLKTRFVPMEWLLAFLDARYDAKLIQEFFYDETLSFKSAVLAYLDNLEDLPFDNPDFESSKTGPAAKQNIKTFNELSFEKTTIEQIYKKGTVYGEIIEHLRENNMLGLTVKINENGEKIDSLFVRTTKWFNPTIEENPQIFSELVSEVKQGIVRCDSMMLARHLGFFKVAGVSNNKAYSIEDHVKTVKWKEWVNNNPEYVPVDASIGIDIDLSRRIVFSPQVLFAKIKDNNQTNHKLLVLPQVSMKTKIKEREDNRFKRFIANLEETKRTFIDVMPWEDYDGIIKCKVIADNNYSFVGNVQVHYEKILTEQQKKFFDIIKVIPSKQGDDIKKNGYNIQIRQNLVENLLNTKSLLVDESNTELMFCIYNIPAKSDGSGIRDEKGVFEKAMDVLNALEYGMYYWKQLLHFITKD